MKLSRMQSIRDEWMKFISREKIDALHAPKHVARRREWLLIRKNEYFFQKDFEGVQAIKWLLGMYFAELI